MRLMSALLLTDATHMVWSSLHDAKSLRPRTGFHATAFTEATWPESTSTGVVLLLCHTYTWPSARQPTPHAKHSPSLPLRTKRSLGAPKQLLIWYWLWTWPTNLRWR